MSARKRLRIASVSLVAVSILVWVPGPVLAQDEGGASRDGQAGTDTLRSVAAADALRAERLFGLATPMSDTTTTDSGTAPQHVDGWGVRRSWGLAVGEVIAINNLVWFFNEYIRGANFTQVNPRSWYNNLFVDGFSYDDNHFTTNMFAHPFHGSLYYNSARSNGFNYWESLPFALGGSLMWECCGETHQPAINDWIMTSIGGTALGEMMHRVSSTVLDNTATGSGRTWREVGALFISPVRGFNRLVSGRWSEVRDNPPDRMPSVLSNQLSAGVRVIGEGESISDSTLTNAFFQVDFNFGSPFSGENRKPFDYFLLGLQVNFSEKTTLGRAQVRGNLFTKDLKVSDKVHHLFSVAQNFDYINNFSYEFGGQSVSASLLSRWNFSETWTGWTALDLYGLLMGAVNSDFAFLAQFPPGFRQERFREYDFGPGGGPGVGLGFFRKGRDVLTLRYRLTYLYTLNGSVREGDQAWHLVHWTYAKAMFPVSRNFGIGAAAGVFLRKSHYTCEITADGEVFPCTDAVQRNPELRFFGRWLVGRAELQVPASN